MGDRPDTQTLANTVREAIRKALWVRVNHLSADDRQILDAGILANLLLVRK